MGCPYTHTLLGSTPHSRSFWTFFGIYLLLTLWRFPQRKMTTTNVDICFRGCEPPNVCCHRRLHHSYTSKNTLRVILAALINMKSFARNRASHLLNLRCRGKSVWWFACCVRFTTLSKLVECVGFGVFYPLLRTEKLTSQGSSSTVLSGIFFKHSTPEYPGRLRVAAV